MSTSCQNTGLSTMSHCHLKTIPKLFHVAYCLKTCCNSVSESLHFIHWRTNPPTILNCRASRNPLDLNHVSMEAGQLVHLYPPPTRKLSIQVPASNETDMCVSATMYKVQFLPNDQWFIGQEVRHIIFQESFVIPPCKPVLRYMGSK
jgi:hypothetical protein